MRGVLVSVLLGVTAGCGITPVLGPAETPPPPPFEECLADEYAFVGQTSIAALGIRRPSGKLPPDPDQVGMIWVTADSRPNRGEPGPGGVVVARMLCIDWPDGSAMTDFPVVDGWRPPGQLPIAGSDPGAGSGPLPLLVLLGAAILIGLSLLVFRERR